MALAPFADGIQEEDEVFSWNGNTYSYKPFKDYLICEICKRKVYCLDYAIVCSICDEFSIDCRITGKLRRRNQRRPLLKTYLFAKTGNFRKVCEERFKYQCLTLMKITNPYKPTFVASQKCTSLKRLAAFTFAANFRNSTEYGVWKIYYYFENTEYPRVIILQLLYADYILHQTKNVHRMIYSNDYRKKHNISLDKY